MKKRFLPIGFLSLLILGLIVLFNLPSVDEVENTKNQRGGQTIAGAKQYLASIRNNQQSGLLNPADVVNARAKMESSSYKSSKDDMQWVEIGPDNIGGRTRALIFDNRDAEAQTMYAGSVTGGVFKTINLGATWQKVNTTSGTANLNVSCMVQNTDGKIYVGTGEGLNTQEYTATGDLGYEGGFVGKGLYVSNGNDEFQLVEGTAPVVQGEVTEWAYVNELAIGPDNKLWAATNTGLKYTNIDNLDEWKSDLKHISDSTVFDITYEITLTVSCDSFEIKENGNFQYYGDVEELVDTISVDTTSSIINERFYIPFETANVTDVKVSDNGAIIATFNGHCYVSEDGDITKFTNKSINPTNYDIITKDDNYKDVVSHTILDQASNVLLDTSYFYHSTLTEYQVTEDPDIYFNSENRGRIEFAISPSEQNIVYALVANSVDNGLFGVYLSEDSGQSWRIVAPGGSNVLNILGATYPDAAGTNGDYYQGDFSNTISVFPNNPYRVLCGGVNLWMGRKTNETGPFFWSRRSEANARPESLNFGTFDPLYVHMDHHVYTFRPGYGNVFAIGTDGGVFQGTVAGDEITFISSNTNYNCTQFYTLDISFIDELIIGGTQDNGPLLVNNGSGYDMWHDPNIPFFYPDGSDGGSVAFSNLSSFGPNDDDFRSPTTYYSRTQHPAGDGLVDRMRRSETLGEDIAVDFLSGPVDNNFISPMLLWEDYNNINNTIGDSVKFTADATYLAGDNVVVRSNNIYHPFDYTLPIDMNEGDTLMVKDVFSTKLFIATSDEIWMSIDAYDFTVAPDWWNISASNEAGFEGTPLSMAVADNANQLYVGTLEGRLFRISNIANAYNEPLADVGSDLCVIATDELIIEGNSQAITGLAVDPADADKLLVTLGNYGNTDYVFYCDNALSDMPTFTSVQNGLPTAPVYCGLFEMDPNTDKVIIGTELGLYTCDDINAVDWYQTGPEIGEVPVMDIKQQTKYKGSFTQAFYDPVTGAASYEYFIEIMNYGDIYIATHGRGIFKVDMDYVGVEENFSQNEKQDAIKLNIYPNPAINDMTLEVDVKGSTNAQMLVYDLAGRLVVTNDLGMMNQGLNKIPVNVSILESGTYMIQVVAGNNVTTSKVIIK